MGPDYCRSYCRDNERGPCAKCPRPAPYPDNEAPWNLFLSSLTQLRYGPAGPTGFDYVGVRAGAEMAGIEINPAVWRGFQHAEGVYLRRIAELAPKPTT